MGNIIHHVGIKVPLVFIFIIGTTPQLWGDGVTAIVPPSNVPVALSEVWTTVDKIYPDVMDVFEDQNGHVWVLTKYQFVKFEHGDLSARSDALNTDISMKDLGSKLPSLSAAYPLSNGRMWAGTWDGHLYSFSEGTWKNVSLSGSSMGRFHTIREHDGYVYFGCAGGLWRSDINKASLKKIEPIEGPVESLLSKPEALYVGNKAGLWKVTNYEQTLVRAIESTDGSVRSISIPSNSGNVYLGTRNGIVKLDAEARFAKRELSGNTITSLDCENENACWAGTWNNGIYLQTNNNWLKFGFKESLIGDTVMAAVIDRRGRFWCGVYGKGVVLTDVHTLKTALTAHYNEFPENLNADKQFDSYAGAPVFANAVEAYKNILNDAPSSGQLAMDNVLGIKTIFWNGKKVTPSGMAYRRPDGAILSVNVKKDSNIPWYKKCAKGTLRWFANSFLCPEKLQNWLVSKYEFTPPMTGPWNLILIIDGKETEVPLPEQKLAVIPKLAFLDSQNRVWIGNDHDGLFVYESTVWKKFQNPSLISPKNHLMAIEEDNEKNIWIGTSPEYDRQTETYPYPCLFKYDGSEWKSYGPDSDHLGWAVSDIWPLKDGGVAAVTNISLRLITPTSDESFKPANARGMMNNISADKSAVFWIGHAVWASGLTWFDGKRFVSKTTRDGIFADRIIQTAHDADNRHWILADDQRVSVYPNSVSMNGRN